MLSLFFAALIINSSGSAVSNHLVPDNYAHHRLAEDGVGRTTWLPEVVVTAARPSETRANALGSIMIDYTPEGTVWLPEVVITAPRPSKPKTGKSQFSRVDQGPDGTIWLSEVIVRAKRIAPAATLQPPQANVLPLVVAGGIVAISMAIGIALLPGHDLPTRPKRLVPVLVRVSRKA